MLSLIKKIVIPFCCLFLVACTTSSGLSVQDLAALQEGKRLFAAKFYKRSRAWLLPLAVDGNPEAQYAIGYMYYYGYGVTQDTETGYFWIKRSADKKYIPAIKALQVIVKQGSIN